MDPAGLRHSTQQVIGSSIKTKFQIVDGKPSLLRLPELNFNDDKGGKPVAINEGIGRRPIAAFGNSDGDLEMLQWTTMGIAPGTRFGMIVHHTDADREYAYDRKSHFGRLDVALDAAPAAGWTVVDMKNDWENNLPVLADYLAKALEFKPPKLPPLPRGTVTFAIQTKADVKTERKPKAYTSHPLGGPMLLP